MAAEAAGRRAGDVRRVLGRGKSSKPVVARGLGRPLASLGHHVLLLSSSPHCLLQSGASGERLGWVDLDLGSSPGWWAASVATYCPSRMVEHP